MEEERRLCYVAITRAKKRLILTHARQRLLFGRTSSNPISRFVLESGVLDDSPSQNAASASAYRPGRSEPVDHRRSGFAPSSGSVLPGRQKSRSMPVAQSKKDPYPQLELEVGSRIHHQAFGDGTVTTMKPMGGDHLLEIRFEDEKVGSKKLMLKAASKFITLISG